MVPVSAAKPCPVCKKPDWCLVAPDGSACLCQRVESPKRRGDAGWLHRLGGPETRVAGKAKPSKPVDSAKTRAGLPASREALAEKLGLPVAALDAIPLLGIRHDTPGVSTEFTIPEARSSASRPGRKLRARKPSRSS